MDEALREYQKDIWRARMSRRGFLAAMGAAGAGAALAACSSSTASSAPSTAPSVAVPSTAASATPAPATPAPSYALETELYLYNWSDYFNPDNKKTFSAQFGIKNFVEDFYASNEEMLAKLQAGGRGQYDVSVPTAEYSETLAKGGFLQKIDKSRLPNLANVNPRFLTMPFDPNDEYIVPKDWGTTGIIYRGSVKEPITSWADFWNLAMTKYSGKTLTVASSSDVFPAALRKNGFDVNTTDTGELEIARQDMMKLRPHLQSIDSDTYPDTLRSGDAVLALAWNGTAYLMQQEAKYKDTGYVIPSEGTIQWVDTWVLLADAPHPNAAYAFLNWIQDPNVQVLESGFAGYASCNDAAKPLLDPAFVSNPAVYVPDDQLALLSIATDQSGNQQRADIWAEFLAG